MSYSSASLGDVYADAVAADSSLLPAGVPATKLSGKCTDFASWKAAQLACNDADIDSAICHQALVRPCPSNYANCPDGQTLVADEISMRAPFGPNKGKWSSGTYRHCASTYSPAAVTQAVTSRWGLYLGLGIAAFVVYKVATG